MKTPFVKQSTILWADDPDEIAIIREALAELGSTIEIVEVKNGKEVLEYLDNAKCTDELPCLIVLDINMPILNGRDTLIRLKQDKEFEFIPIVAFTTSSSILEKEFCRHYNTDMLTKPITFEALKQVVRKLLQLCEFLLSSHNRIKQIDATRLNMACSNKKKSRCKDSETSSGILNHIKPLEKASDRV